MKICKTIFQNLILVLFILAIGIITGEIFVRFSNQYKTLNKIYYNRYRAIDPILSHVFKPKTEGYHYGPEFKTFYKINSLGMRDREYTFKKPRGAYRILMMGDSYTEGWGVNIEDTYCKKLESLLNNNNKNRRYEAINAGIMSISAIRQYLELKQKLIYLESDLVISQFDLCDISEDYENMQERAILDASGLPLAIPHHDFLSGEAYREKKGTIKRFLHNRSAFYIFASSQFKKGLRKIRQKLKLLKREEKKPLNFFVLGDPRTDQFFMFRPQSLEHTKTLDKYWSCSKRYLKAMKVLCSEKGAKFMIFLTPVALQVSPDEWTDGRNVWGFDNKQIYDNPYLRLKIQKFAEKENILFLDPLSNLQKDKANSLYFRYDGHFTPEGHAHLAEAIYNFFISSSVQNILN